jgi:hypothetical protein
MWLPQFSTCLCLAVLAVLGRANAYEGDKDVKSIPVRIFVPMHYLQGNMLLT